MENENSVEVTHKKRVEITYFDENYNAVDKENAKYVMIREYNGETLVNETAGEVES